MMLVLFVLLLLLLLDDTTGVVVIVTVFAVTDDTVAVCPLSIEVLPLSLPSGFIFLRRLYGVKRRTGPEAALRKKESYSSDLA